MKPTGSMVVMTATASDYLWFRDYRRGWLLDGYCLTYVAGLSPGEFLDRIGADDREQCAGLDAFADRDGEFNDSQEVYGDFMFIGATGVPGRGGDWVLALEINGMVGTTDEFMTALSTGSTAVSHYLNGNALDIFSWYENGELRTRFEPLAPSRRSGRTPDALVDDMRQAGFDLTGTTYRHHTEAAFALAERLTGVRVTEAMLDNADYQTGIVEMPTEDWTHIVVDITDANGERSQTTFVNPAHRDQNSG